MLLPDGPTALNLRTPQQATRKWPTCGRFGSTFYIPLRPSGSFSLISQWPDNCSGESRRDDGLWAAPLGGIGGADALSVSASHVAPMIVVAAIIRIKIPITNAI
jgi:hypothetical protein